MNIQIKNLLLTGLGLIIFGVTLILNGCVGYEDGTIGSAFDVATMRAHLNEQLQKASNQKGLEP